MVNEKVKQPTFVTVKVCDEAKGAEGDFHCELDILVTEMPYFKEFLVKNDQFINGIEILVHCDLNIFEWLLSYARRNIEPTAYQECSLSTTNVLALLVSSNFLKMQCLISECLDYFCKHASTIIASPFSLDCLNDNLVGRIASGMNLDQLDKIKDKKDKLKSKLYIKKLEHLFDPAYHTSDCPNNAAYLYNCFFQSCKRCGRQFPIIELGDGCFYHPMEPIPLQSDQLINENHSKTVKPIFTRTTDKFQSPDCNAFKQDITPNHQTNSDSSGFSKKYTQSNTIESLSNQMKPGLIHPCCGFGLSRFNLFPIQTGCHRNEHILDEESSDPVTKLCIQHREMIISWASKRSFNPHNAPGLMTVGGYSYHSVDFNQIIFNKDIIHTAPVFTLLTCLDKQLNEDKTSVLGPIRLTINNQSLKSTYETLSANQSEQAFIKSKVEEKDSNKESCITPLVHSTNLLSSTFSERLWDSTKCNRINQDNQRQEDLRRMQRINEFVCAQRQITSTSSDSTVSKE
ncbi:unnamed protein product [Trichobilharzia szidati]|nr:unnamed protein product [Trichobilharzia szidati]